MSFKSFIVLILGAIIAFLAGASEKILGLPIVPYGLVIGVVGAILIFWGGSIAVKASQDKYAPSYPAR